jgi:TolB-like protein
MLFLRAYIVQRMRPSRRVARALACALFALCACAAFGQTVTVALLGVTNKGGDPRQEYLAGIIQGILLFDLSAQKDIEVVDRAHLDDVLKEQELRLSAVIDDQGKALQVGKVLGADYLLRVEYVFLGDQIQASAAVVAVATAKTATFAERGSTENMIHALSERVIQRLTGNTVSLRSPQRELSILSLQDETPGSIALYAGLIEAEIFLDGEFTGYSGEDTRTPFIIDSVKPGSHALRIHLPRFGVVSLPEFSFHDWEQAVDVKPGKRQVVRATAAHYNDIIYKLQSLNTQELRFAALSEKPLARSTDISFVGRDGKKVAASLDLTATRKGDIVRVDGVLSCAGEKTPFTVESSTEDAETKVNAGKVELSVEIDRSFQRVSCSAWRTDIWQNMDMEDSP